MDPEDVSESEAVNEEHILRPLHCELGVLGQPDGSAMLAQGKTTTVAAVYGPVEIKQLRLLIDRAYVETVYRPTNGQPSISDRKCEEILQSTFEAAIITNNYPRSGISIIVHEMEDSGGILACAINSACLALINSGLAMKFLIAAVHCAIDSEGKVILDPDAKNLEEQSASLTFAFDSVNKNLISSESFGRFTEAQYQEALLKCRSASDEIINFYRSIVKKYAPTIT